MNIIEKQSTGTHVLVTIFSPELVNESTQLASTLRNASINTELYLDTHAKLEKQLKYADKKGIPYVIIQGPEEKERQLLNLKNMKTREEKKNISIDEAISNIISAHDNI
jgi:histidyl-tRNA synthetase